eukprot:scaffold439660_cov19-Prasinocladus_malaysianus.AAC.1
MVVDLRLSEVFIKAWSVFDISIRYFCVTSRKSMAVAEAPVRPVAQRQVNQLRDECIRMFFLFPELI